MSCCCCTSILFWILAAAIAFKLYLKLRIRRNGSYVCLAGKTAIVTGANAGIGYVTALDLVKRGAKVILACRNEDRAKDAQRRIIKESENHNVFYKLVNFSSLESVRAFAKDINETEDKIDILVNNAGAGGLGNHITNDGAEITLQVNHLSAFLLTHLLLDKIKKSAPSRIVNVSSIAASRARLNPSTMNEYPRDTNNTVAGILLYANSKLLNILFTTELATKLRGTNVTVNVLHPGAVSTEIFRRLPGIAKIFVDFLMQTYFKTSEEGAQTTIYLATSNDVKNVSGKLFDNCREIDLYETAKDQDLARISWQKCEELVKLSDNEKIK